MNYRWLGVFLAGYTNNLEIYFKILNAGSAIVYNIIIF